MHAIVSKFVVILSSVLILAVIGCSETSVIGGTGNDDSDGDVEAETDSPASDGDMDTTETADNAGDGDLPGDGDETLPDGDLDGSDVPNDGDLDLDSMDGDIIDTEQSETDEEPPPWMDCDPEENPECCNSNFNWIPDGNDCLTDTVCTRRTCNAQHECVDSGEAIREGEVCTEYTAENISSDCIEHSECEGGECKWWLGSEGNECDAGECWASGLCAANGECVPDVPLTAASLCAGRTGACDGEGSCKLFECEFGDMCCTSNEMFWDNQGYWKEEGTGCAQRGQCWTNGQCNADHECVEEIAIGERCGQDGCWEEVCDAEANCIIGEQLQEGSLCTDGGTDMHFGMCNTEGSCIGFECHEDSWVMEPYEISGDGACCNVAEYIGGMDDGYGYWYSAGTVCEPNSSSGTCQTYQCNTDHECVCAGE